MNFNFEQFQYIVSDVAHITKDSILHESRITEDLGIESITLLNIVTAIEEEYDIIFDSLDFQNIQTAGQAYSYLLDLMRKQYG